MAEEALVGCTREFEICMERLREEGMVPSMFSEMRQLETGWV
jgi:hypothetical protein